VAHKYSARLKENSVEKHSNFFNTPSIRKKKSFVTFTSLQSLFMKAINNSYKKLVCCYS
jgi:hypothetical protein